MDGDYRILVALDGSERAAGVLATAVDLALGRGAELILLRVVGVPLELPAEVFALAPTDVPTLLRGLAELDLERLAASAPPELLVTKRVRVGVPWDAIVEEASACRADLIVIGSHGYRGLDRLLGTTAGRVVNHAPCSTLVVRSPARTADKEVPRV